ncbi:MAG: TetR/AcrR family transcriptional regulator [Caldilineaceae bacterium]|nr:TetR/AcrR family transcriptional regulator [Caldilineaceae bacterium]
MIESTSELSPRERRHQRTQQAIIDAARQIIRESGVDTLSMRAIADRIDYSPAGLYEYFGSKEEIIGAVCEQSFERLAQRLQRVDQALPPTEYLLELGMAYIDFAVHNADSFLLMFTTLPLSGTQTKAEQAEQTVVTDEQNAFGILYQGIERCVHAGIYHPKPGFDVLEMTYASWTQVHGLAMLHITNAALFPFDYTTVERATLRAFGAGLAQA